MSNASLRFALLALCLSACTSPPVVDAGRDSGTAPTDVVPADVIANDSRADATRCTSDTDCSDGVFCNGIEHCSPADPAANANGCAAAATRSPCTTGQTCEETARRCVTPCADADNDGHTAAECGGDDCDDTDATRFPGRAETCDPTHDEDCDTLTFGFRDNDHDGYGDARCCNAGSMGAPGCGNDCDDSNANVHPNQPESCNTLDDNCNGMIDDGITRTLYVDADTDGYGAAAGATPVMGCTDPPGFVPNNNDCDDVHPTAHPGGAEVCDSAAIDEDCNGAANEGCTCITGASQLCCSSRGSQRCVTGTWGACSITAIVEVCNGVDDDCDGVVDNGVTATIYTDIDRDGYGTGAGRIGCAGTPDTATVAGDCNDTPGPGNNVHPGAAEACNHIDDNCDGAVDEGVQRLLYVDLDRDGYTSVRNRAMACISDPGTSMTPGDDCFDSSTNPNAANAHPGQTAYFRTPYQTYCATIGCISFDTWDYDCIGGSTPPPRGSTSCNGFLCSRPPFECGGGGYLDVTVGCGRPTMYVPCGACNACAAQAMQTVPLACR